MKKILNVGIDIGSTTVKMVVIDKKNNVLFEAYERHYSDTKKTLIDLFNKILEMFSNCKFTFILTGSGAISLSKHLNVPFVQEVIACKNAIKEYAPSTDVAIVLNVSLLKLEIVKLIFSPFYKMLNIYIFVI